MAAQNPSASFGLDPLIAEAKQRARRRRALALAVLVVIAGAATGMYFAMRGPSTAAISDKSASGLAGTPFVDAGGEVAGYNGFMGDRGGGPLVTTLGCIDRRHYEEGFPLRNRSRGPVTVLSAQWRSPAPGIIDGAATQLRLAPYEQGVIGMISRTWSARSNLPVTIPPNRLGTLQSNFIFSQCGQLDGGRSVAGPGSLIIRYRVSGGVREAVLRPSSQAFVLVAGPRRQACAAVLGAISLLASNVSCAAAQEAALACRRLSHNTYGSCITGKVRWLCDHSGAHGRHHVETCQQTKNSRRHGSSTLPHGFRVNWNPAT